MLSGRTKAFTLPELIVSMLIATILFSIAFGGLFMAEKLAGRLYADMSQSNAKLAFLLRMERDVEAAHNIRVYADSLVLEFYNNSATYTFGEHTYRNGQLFVKEFSIGLLIDSPAAEHPACLRFVLGGAETDTLTVIKYYATADFVNRPYGG